MEQKRFESMDALIQHLCKVTAFHPDLLCYVVVEPDQEQRTRQQISKVYITMGLPYEYYEMRKEHIVLGHNRSRIRLIVAGNPKDAMSKLSGIECNIIASEAYLGAYVSHAVRRGGGMHAYYFVEGDMEP